MGETYILSMNEANTIEMMDYCGDKLKTPSYIKNGWFKIDLPVKLLKKELINDLLRYDEKYNVITPKYESFINSNSNMIKVNYEPKSEKMTVNQYLSTTQHDGSYMVGMELNELEFVETSNKVKTYMYI